MSSANPVSFIKSITAALYKSDLVTNKHRRFIQYLSVGVLGIGINQGVLYFATGIIGLPYLMGGFFGQVISLSTNYAINDFWTWGRYGDDGFSSWVIRGLKYGGTRVVGVGIHLIALTILVEFFHIHYLIANLLAIGIGVFWGFGVSDLWVWKTTDSPTVFDRVGSRGKAFVNNIDRATKHVVILTVVMFVGFSVYSILLYRGFWFTGGDFGSYVHAFETTRQGVGFLHTGRYRIGNPTSAYWGEHFSLTLLAVYPLYWLFPYQETLLVVKSACLALSIPLLWMVARDHLSTQIAKFTVFLYALNPFLASAWLFDFQEQMFLPGLVFGAYYCYRNQRRLLFIILIAAVLLTNEFLVYIVGGALLGFVVMSYTSDSRRVRADWPMLVGMGVLLVCTHLLSGYIIGQYNQFSGIPTTAIAEPFRPLLESQRVGTGELLSLLVGRPDLLFESFASDIITKMIYFVLFLVPVGFISLYDELTVFSLAPFLGFAWVLTGSPIYYTFGAHYPFYLLPFLFIGAIRVMDKVEYSLGDRKMLKRIFMVILLLNVSVGVGVAVDRKAIPQQTEHQDRVKTALETIPSDATLVTQNDLYPHVANRPQALFIVSSGTYFEYELRHDVQLPQYILFDTKIDSKQLDWAIPIQQAYRRELVSEYGLYRYEDDIWIFKKGYEGEIRGVTSDYRAPEKTFGVSELQVDEGVIYNNKIESTVGNANDAVWYGPYISLPPGTYDVTFLVNVDHRGESPVAALDVVSAPGPETIAEQTVEGTDGWEEVTLRVTLDEYTWNLEFRGIRETEVGTIAVRRVTVTPVTE